MSLSNKIIHQEKFLKLSNFVSFLLLATMWVFFYNAISENLWIIVPTIILLGVIVVTSHRKSAFLVYDDRIELFNAFSNKLIDVIRLDQIDQIRYEDSFSDSYGLFFCDFLLIYPKKDAGIKNLKNDRITLAVTGFNRISKILLLLKFFQSKHIEVVIKTDSKKIHKETGLKNWNHVQ